MANIQKFESIKGNIFYVTMFDGETVTLPHQNIQNNTIALIRGNGVVALSSGEITIHGSASFLFYNNKWNYVTPEVTRERLDDEVEKLNQAIETLSEELNPLKPQEYVLQVVPETGLEMVNYQTYRVGKVVFIFVTARNNTDNVITINTNENTIQLVGGQLKPYYGRLDNTINDVRFSAVDTEFIGPTNKFTMDPNGNISLYGFLFTN
jgi:hypothetical protein